MEAGWREPGTECEQNHCGRLVAANQTILSRDQPRSMWLPAYRIEGVIQGESVNHQGCKSALNVAIVYLL